MLDNLLNSALNAIGHQVISLERFSKRELNNVGVWVNTYSSPEDIKGSWQPVGADDVHTLGLDENKKYYNFFTSNVIDSVNRGSSPDKVTFNGKIHHVVGVTDWYPQNGWRGLLCVEVDDD